MAKVKKSTVKRRMKWGLIKTGVKLPLSVVASPE